MTDCKVGDRVRATWTKEGVVKRIIDTPECCIEFEDGIHVYPHSYHGAPMTIEVLEPEYEAGAMYVDADGDFFAYCPANDKDHPWLSPGTGIGYGPKFPSRPLRKLVPEGE